MVADTQPDAHDPFGAAASDPKAPINAGNAFVDDPIETAPPLAAADAAAPFGGAADEADAPTELIDAAAPAAPSHDIAEAVNADLGTDDLAADDLTDAVAADGDEPIIDDPEAPTAEELDAAQAELDAAAAREEQLTRLFTATIMGPGEERIGKVGQVYLDDQTQEPNWVTAKTGLFGTKEFFIPLDEAQLDGKHIIVPYTKADVTTAPVTEIDQNLSPDEEDALYNHYRVPGRMTIDPDAAVGDEDESGADALGDDPIDAPDEAEVTSIESVIDEAAADEHDAAEVGADAAVTAAPHAPLAEPHTSAPPQAAPSAFAAPSPFAAPADAAAAPNPLAEPAAAVDSDEVQQESESRDDSGELDGGEPDREPGGAEPDDSPFRRPTP